MTETASQTEEYDVMTSFLSGANECPASDLAIATDRAEKVADLKYRIQAGNYQPDLEKVAESLLNYIMADKC